MSGPSGSHSMFDQNTAALMRSSRLSKTKTDVPTLNKRLRTISWAGNGCGFINCLIYWFWFWLRSSTLRAGSVTTAPVLLMGDHGSLISTVLNCHFRGGKKSFFTWKRPASVVAGFKTARHWEEEHSAIRKLAELRSEKSEDSDQLPQRPG